MLMSLKNKIKIKEIKEIFINLKNKNYNHINHKNRMKMQSIKINK